MESVSPNNYLKVTWGTRVVDMFLFNDTLLKSASKAHRDAVECLDRTMKDAAEVDRAKSAPRAPREVVRMSLFRPCPCMEGILQNHVGVWKCPKCLASYEDCTC